jgi:SAM-dependent methyltransferase
MDKLDIGCGPDKDPSFTGLDIHPYPGVDIVFDVDSGERWPIDDDSFDYIRGNHVIEHVNDTAGFFREVHRIARDGAILHLETPHYSSANSWGDPTHVKHFAVKFTDAFTQGYLGPQLPEYELVSRRITFGSFFHTWPGRLICWLRGPVKYEKYYAFRWPASSVIVDLRVVKKTS